MPSYEEKVELFIKEYLVSGNASQAARAAGYSANRASKAGYELKNKPEIAARINEVAHLEHAMLTDGEGSIDTIVENNLPKALMTLARNMDDPKVAKDFWTLASKHLKDKEISYGEYDGLTTGQIVRELDTAIEEAQSLKIRVMEEVRKGTLSE